MSKSITTRYRVELEAPATPDDPEGIRRLRRWLKQAWRGYALRCVKIGLAVQPPQAPAGPADAGGGEVPGD